MNGEKIFEKIFGLLPEDKQTEFMILVEVGNREKIQEFIKTMLPDIEKAIDENINVVLPRNDTFDNFI